MKTTERYTGTVAHDGVPAHNDPKPFRKIVENDLEADVLNDLRGAAKMLDQALNRLHPSLDLRKEIKEVDGALDSIVTALQDGDYDREAK